DVQEWLQEIESYTERLKETVASLNDEELNKKYREGSWTVRQLVHHIADSQLNMYQRLRQALTDDNPVVPAFATDKWAPWTDTLLPDDRSSKMLEGMNERIVAVENELTEEQMKRKYTLEGNEEITLAKKLAKLAWHEEHHLAHIKIALPN